MTFKKKIYEGKAKIIFLIFQGILNMWIPFIKEFLIKLKEIEKLKL